MSSQEDEEHWDHAVGAGSCRGEEHGEGVQYEDGAFYGAFQQQLLRQMKMQTSGQGGAR